MKKTLLSFALCVLYAGAMAQEQSSPYMGTTPVKGGVYYLYNVKSGKWLDAGKGPNGADYGSYGTQAGFGDKGTPVQLVDAKTAGQIGIKFVGTVNNKTEDTCWGYFRYSVTDGSDEADVREFGATWDSNTGYGAYYSDQALSNCEAIYPTKQEEGLNLYKINVNAGGIIAYYNYVEGSQVLHLKKAGDVADGADLWQFVSADEYNFTSKSIQFATAAEGYSTLCLPRQTVIPSGVTAYKASEPDAEGYVTLTAIIGTVLPAYEAVLLKGVAGESYTFDADVNAAIDNFADNYFRGNSLSEAVAVPEEYDYVLTLGPGNINNKIGFYKYTGSEIGANKAYYPVAKTIGANLMRGFSIAIDDDATDIKEIVNSKSLNGQYYDLQGRSVANPQRGIYIVNGKKLIIK